MELFILGALLFWGGVVLVLCCATPARRKRLQTNATDIYGPPPVAYEPMSSPDWIDRLRHVTVRTSSRPAAPPALPPASPWPED